MDKVIISVADSRHLEFAQDVCELIADSAKKRGTGIAKRSPEYISQKISEGKAVIATTKSGSLVGFCYIESWGNSDYVANSGLIVHYDFRKQGLAAKIKEKAFKLARKLYPNAKLFGLTTSSAVMKINSELGYRPVIFSQLTDDEKFWKGCSSCVNYQILQSKEQKNCLCTAMLFDPSEKNKKLKKLGQKMKMSVSVFSK